MTAEQFERLKAELEQGFVGANKAGRPLLLEGGLDWKPLSLSPKDMDFIEAKNSAAREIALALGVPPMLLGIPGDNTYSNYQEAQRAFWRQTVLPLVNRTATALARWLAPAFETFDVPGGRLPGGESLGANERVPPSAIPDASSNFSSGALELKPDLDQVEALSSEREALWARLERTTFLTADEKRAAVGYGPMPVSEAQPAPFDAPPSGGTGVVSSLKYSPDQPRADAGNSDGGQWVDAGGGSGSSTGSASSGGSSGGTTDHRVLSDAIPDLIPAPGTQFAQITPDDKPKIPPTRPPTGKLRNRTIKEVAKWAAKEGIKKAAGLIGVVIEVGSWVWEARDYVDAYLDDPKSLGELQSEVSTPATGFDIHHIVEQTPAEKEGFLRNQIDGPDNLVRIPTLKHWEINGWYSRSREEFGGLSPRDYLRGKGWSEKTRVGRLALVRHGVLKP